MREEEVGVVVSPPDADCVRRVMEGDKDAVENNPVWLNKP